MDDDLVEWFFFAINWKKWYVFLHVCHLVAVGCTCNPTWALAHVLAFQKILDNSRTQLGTTIFLNYVDMDLLIFHKHKYW